MVQYFSIHMEQNLINDDLIRRLCASHDQALSQQQFVQGELLSPGKHTFIIAASFVTAELRLLRSGCVTTFAIVRWDDEAFCKWNCHTKHRVYSLVLYRRTSVNGHLSTKSTMVIVDLVCVHKLSFSYVQKEEKMGFNLVQKKTFICDN